MVPSLQHLPHHPQDCLPPQPRAGLPQASLRQLPRLEEDQQAPQGLWSSNTPATMPEWRELCPARPLSPPCRMAGRHLPDRRGRMPCWRGEPVPRTASTPRVPGSGRTQPIRRRCALPAQVKDSQGSPKPHDRNGRCGRRGGAEASVKTGCAGAEAAAGAGPTAQSGLEGPGAQAA